jgi:hypothetical protein
MRKLCTSLSLHSMAISLPICWRILALSTVLLPSCASYEVVQVSKTDTKEGVRFYRPAPYLLIGVEAAVPAAEAKPGALKKELAPEKPTLTAKLIYLPDHSQQYVIHRKGGLGTSEVTASLQDGWNLVSYGSKSDSKIPETITAVASLATSIAGLGFTEGSTAFPSPGLWRIQFDDTSGFVTDIVLVKPSNK